MSTIQMSPVAGFKSAAFLKAIFMVVFLFGQILAFAETPVKDPILVSKSDSIQAAAKQAAEDAAAMKRENINTVLEVVGSVVAIVIIILITWKMSSGPQANGPKSASGGGSAGESHQDVMARRMKMAKK
jgi:hypothetical protein